MKLVDLKNIFSNKSVRNIIGNSFWLFVDKIIRLVLGLFVFSLFARYYGPELIGKYNYALAFTYLFSIFVTLGLDKIIVKEITKGLQQSNEILGSTYLLRQISSLIITVLTVIIYSFLKNDAYDILLIVIFASTMLFTPLSNIELWFQAKKEAKYTTIVKLIAFIVSSILKFAVIILHLDLIYMALLNLVESILGTLLLIYIYNKKDQSIFLWNFKLAKSKELFKEGFPLLLSGVAVALYMKLDQIIIGQMLGDYDVGIYSSAVKIVEIWYFIPVALATTLFPYLIKHRFSKNYNHVAKLFFATFFWISILGALFAQLLPNDILNLLLGDKYIGATVIFKIHMWAGIFVFLGVATTQYLLNEDSNSIVFYRSLLGAIVNIILNFILIPYIGILGAAYATLISYAISGFISLPLFKSGQKPFYITLASLNLFNVYNSLLLIINNEKNIQEN